MEDLGKQYENVLKITKQRVTTQNKQSGQVIQDIYRASAGKPILDEIDTILAEHYGFSAEELDYIVNYDIKYRMGLGRSGAGGEEEE